jgi:hypothetical protein
MFISKEEPGGAISGDQLTNNLIADRNVIAQRPNTTSIRNAALPQRVRQSHQGGSKMTKLLISAAALIALLVVTDAAFAAGTSRNAPGHKMHNVHGTPGASYNSPGHMYLRAGKTSVRGHPGASGYAPGHHVH